MIVDVQEKDAKELAEITVFCWPNGGLLWFRQFYAPGKHLRARNMAAAPDVDAVRRRLQDYKSCVFVYAAVWNTWTATQAHSASKNTWKILRTHIGVSCWLGPKA